MIYLAYCSECGERHHVMIVAGKQICRRCIKRLTRITPMVVSRR